MKNNSLIITIILCLNFSANFIVCMEKENEDPYLLLSRANNNNWDYVEKALPAYTGDINATNKDGYTLLHLAVLAENVPCVKILIAKKANVNIESANGLKEYNPHLKMWENLIETPLHCAAQTGNTEIVTLLLDADASINSTYHPYNSTPLHLAAWFGHPHCIKTLIDRGATVDSTNGHGSTPLHLAAWRNEPLCLTTLLENGANFLKKSTTGEGNTPLYLAAKTGSLECLRLLLQQYQKSGKNNLLDETCSGNNTTAVQTAGALGRPQCYWDLVLAGANYKRKYQDTPNKSIYVSEAIYGNPPLKEFIYTIEARGIPNKYDGDRSSCYLCKVPYNNFDDVIIELNNCKDVFHSYCFEQYALKDCLLRNTVPLKSVIQNRDITKADDLRKILQDFRVNMIGATINWMEIKKCPQCEKPTKMDDAKLLLF